MPGVGNHERYYNYTSYMKRYHLPRIAPNQTNLWFSFDYGQVHMVHFSSEHPYMLGSEQYSYLEADLKKARNNPNIQWIFLGVHRAFYSSLSMEFANITNLAYQLEDLINKYDVDIVHTGHLHDYERTWPTFKGKAMKDRTNHTHYMSPDHPIYVVQGTAGALIKGKFVKPAPEWSAKTSELYGYGRVTIKGGHLKYQYITIPTGRIVDEWNIVKNVTRRAPLPEDS